MGRVVTWFLSSIETAERGVACASSDQTSDSKWYIDRIPDGENIQYTNHCTMG